jgi:hypothetical protein
MDKGPYNQRKYYEIKPLKIAFCVANKGPGAF